MGNLIKETFLVRGMACTGCEAVIEEALAKLDGITEAKADFAKKTVAVTYEPDRISFEKLSAFIKETGYEISREQTSAVSKQEKKKGKTLSAPLFIGIVVVLTALYLILSSTGVFNFVPQVTTSMGYGLLFVVGLLTSLHCIAMCGGINMSQCVNSGAAAGVKGKVRPSLLYNLGRVTSYTLIGGIVGAAGAVISFSGWARGIVAILSGVFMIIMGLSMTGLFPWINKITPRLPRVFRDKTGAAGKGKGSYIVGLLNGLMPCGPLQAMQLYALGTGSFITGALSMFFFSLGTLPLMFGFGAIVTLLGSRFTQKMMTVSAVLVAVLGIVMMGRGFALSGVALPAIGTETPVEAGAPSAPEAEIIDGVMNITTDLTSRGYPTITVQKGVPIVWNLRAEAKNLNGCNRSIVIPAFDLKVDLKPGDNMIEFTPTEDGTIRYTCWMGMISGQIKVVDDINDVYDIGGTPQQDTADESDSPAPYGLPAGGGGCCAAMSSR